MKDKREKVVNLKINFLEKCSIENKEIIKLYWEYKEKDFVNKPSILKTQYKLTQTELLDIVVKNSFFSFHLFCKNCYSYVPDTATSQSKFKEIKHYHLSSYSESFRCNHCKEEKRKNDEIEDLRKKENLARKRDLAINNKNWENLSNFEREVLENCFIMNFNDLKRHYIKMIGFDNFYQLIRALNSIEDQGLIILYKNFHTNYIESYQVICNLKLYKKEITPLKKTHGSIVKFTPETNEIKFKLTINENQQHPDQPMHAGTVTFKERIVIEPGVEYIFGQWKRANDSLYLTMIPIDQLEKTPIQKRISNTPISLKKGITDFLNNIAEDHHF